MITEYVGTDPLTERKLYILNIPDTREQPSLRLSSPRFVCLLIWDAEDKAVEVIAHVVEWLLDTGAVYFCCWGKDCERVHDIVDEIQVDRDPDVTRLVMTTWHTDEPLDEVVYFALNAASPHDTYAEGCESLLAVCINDAPAAKAVRAAFADPRGFCSRLAEDD